MNADPTPSASESGEPESVEPESVPPESLELESVPPESLESVLVDLTAIDLNTVLALRRNVFANSVRRVLDHKNDINQYAAFDSVLGSDPHDQGE